MKIPIPPLLFTLILCLSSMLHATPYPDYALGGGESFSPLYTENMPGFDVVTTEAELKAALKTAAHNAKKNTRTRIFVQGTLTFLAQRGALVIPDFVTLVSDRGYGGSSGATLRFEMDSSQGANAFPTIVVGSHVTISGLTIEGPSTAIDEISLAYGIQQQNGTHLTVSNCELKGWPGAAISFKKSTQGKVIYNYIHHNQRRSRGYGVVVQNGNAQADIMYNVFDYNRHGIAGSGKPGEVYTAAWNLVLPHRNGHAFDMHKANNGPQGGKKVVIEHNIFDQKHDRSGPPAISIRAMPTSGPATIVNNWFKLAHTYDYKGNKRLYIRGPGSPDKATLEANNTFQTAISYDKTACTVNTPTISLPVDCVALSTVP